MFIESVDLQNFRNYGALHLELGEGVHIFYGDNAQGKTNLLEALFLGCTGKMIRAGKDREMISFSEEESHIKLFVSKNDLKYRIDMHLRAGKAKGIAVNQVAVRKTRDFIGQFPAIIFFPDDLNLVKEGPQERRKFLDTELCSLDSIYCDAYSQYKKALDQRNQLLKDLSSEPGLIDTLDLWDAQMVKYGKTLIHVREEFIKNLQRHIEKIHSDLTGQKEHLRLGYEPNVSEEEFSEKLKRARERDLKAKTSTVGPHRDDVMFEISTLRDGAYVQPIDARVYGSQGQQRSSALSLKLAEIQVVKEKTNLSPILFLDDVLSELDGTRQKFLLESIKETQTFITCTGLDDFIEHQFEIHKVYRVKNGEILNGND